MHNLKNAHKQEFALYLLKAGNKKLFIGTFAGTSTVTSNFVGCGELNNFIFSYLEKIVASEILAEMVILAPRNEDCANVIYKILLRLKVDVKIDLMMTKSLHKKSKQLFSIFNKIS